MSANINVYTGRSAAWHREGTVKGRHQTWAEVAATPGMSYDVEKRQLEFNGKPVEAWGTFRTDNDVFLGSVGAGYQVIDHKSGFEMIDELMGSTGAHYETAGVLGKGEVVWGLADLAVSIKVGGEDESKGYLLFSTSYNGTKAHQWKKCVERVVCANTLAVALAEKTAHQFKVWHNKQAVARLADAKLALSQLKGEFTSLEEKLNMLNERKVTKETAASLFERLFPVPDGPTAKNYQTRRDTATVGILTAFESNDNNAFPDQRGTAYNLLNAVTEWTDHVRGRGDGAKSALFGTGEQIKAKAFEVLLEGANGMSVKSRTVYVPAPVVAAPAEFSLDAVLAATSNR